MRWPVRVAAAAVALLLGSGTATGATSAPDEWRSLSHTRTVDRFAHASVWLYGDSITNQTYTGLASPLAAQGVTTAVDAWSGRPTGPTVDQLLADLAQHPAPQTVIMAVGSNDFRRPQMVREQIERAKAAVSEHSGTRLVWVNVYVVRAGKTERVRRMDRSGTVQVNREIRAAIPQADVVDWYGFIRRRRWVTTVYLRDGVHTTAAGGLARNALILRTIEHHATAIVPAA